ncbi:hypothetical protein B0T26DRAFT_276661 [Lasiosphaeria miniovina]|uniref:Uncharacterized protein n=1 Tax=Lasiosphaeria miniovina TaxID=1954250 RepID=A0AA40DZA5_9PEZI|nr:uncharacterized protein B0T26DRAFT_276661 [Lasiosphaeria miniovina]KAK0717033.1 hypothetical protein B0T26DRAFT_276661 [Lasiosphaeria miniovina]
MVRRGRVGGSTVIAKFASRDIRLRKTTRGRGRGRGQRGKAPSSFFSILMAPTYTQSSPLSRNVKPRACTARKWQGDPLPRGKSDHASPFHATSSQGRAQRGNGMGILSPFVGARSQVLYCRHIVQSRRISRPYPLIYTQFRVMLACRGTLDGDLQGGACQRRGLADRAGQDVETTTLDKLIRDPGSGTTDCGLRQPGKAGASYQETDAALKTLDLKVLMVIYKVILTRRPLI